MLLFVDYINTDYDFLFNIIDYSLFYKHFFIFYNKFSGNFDYIDDFLRLSIYRELLIMLLLIVGLDIICIGCCLYFLLLYPLSFYFFILSL